MPKIIQKITGKILLEVQGDDLRGANLQRSDLRWADLRGADLRWANLSGANLCMADLRGANLQRSDLRWADLRGADLDFSSWGLSCNTTNVKVSDKLVSQLAWHIAQLDVSGCSEKTKKLYCTMYESATFKELANTFCTFRDDVEKI